MNSFLHFKKLLIITLLLMMGNVCLGQTSAQDVLKDLNSRIGQCIDEDKKWGCQCVDVTKYVSIKYFTRDIAGNANQLDELSRWPTGTVKIDYYNGLVPNPGDFYIWNNYGTNGHIGIVESANATKYTSLDQNYVNPNTTKGSPLARVNHTSYKNVTCFMRLPYANCPSIPTTTTPSTAQTNVGIPVFFNWDDVSGSNPQYRIHVSTSNSGWTALNGFTTATSPTATIRVNQGALSQSEFQWTTDVTTTYPPQAFTTYYYTVKSFVCGQNSSWSAVKSFTTGCIASTATVSTPTNGQTNVFAPVNFDWSASSGTDPSYRIQVSTNPNTWNEYEGFTTATTANPTIRVIQGGLTQSAYQWTSSSTYPPQAGVTYYWSVKTFACGNNAKWSPVRSFTIGTSSNCTITVSATPTIGGSVSGNGTFTCGSSRTVTATANSGYSFTNWTENGTQVSANASYNFTLSSNRNLVANFSQITSNCSISVSASPQAGGSVSGNGTFTCGSSRTVIATANSGYTFSNWTENGNVVSTNASYPFTLSANRTLVANFTPNTTGTTINIIGTIGAVTFPNSIGNNKLRCKSEKNISFSIRNVSTATVVRSFKLYIVDMNNNFIGELWNANNLSLLPNETKTFNRTTNTTLGSSVESAAGLYKLVLKGDTGTVGNITLDSPSVVCQNGSCNPQNIEIECPCTLNINANPSAGGTVNGFGTFTCGTSRTVTATANSGYTFSNWTENGNVVSTNASYPFTLSANRTLVANFTQNQTGACLSCPNHDFSPSINSNWGNHSSSIQSNGCKIYRFLAVPGNTYTFKTGCEDGANSSFDSVLDLFDTNCGLLTSNNDFCLRTSRIDWVCNFTATNWVYLKVKGSQSASGNYTLAYTALPTLSINNPDSVIDGLTIYPNPTKDIINITTNQIEINMISIINNLGSIIKTIKVNNSEYKLNIQDLPASSYLLKIETDKGSQTVKIIKK